MADDFRVGDVVVCIAIPQGSIKGEWEPKIGGIYKVYDLYLCPTDDSLLIALEQDPERDGPGAFEANAFRKLPPASDEFTLQMRACKPHKAPVNA